MHRTSRGGAAVVLMMSLALGGNPLFATPPSEPPTPPTPPAPPVKPANQPTDEERATARRAAEKAARYTEQEVQEMRAEIRALVAAELLEAERGVLARRPADEAVARRLASMPASELLHTVVRTRDRHLGDAADLFADLEKVRIAYVAESHDNPAHHRVQLAVVEAMYRQNPDLAIGLEMFTRPCQLTLDLFTAGLLTHEEFVEEVNWKEVWGFDYELYKPIFEFARAHRVPLVALNAPRDLVRKVGRGGVAGLTAEERASIPQVNLRNAKHREHFKQQMERLTGSGHGVSENSYQAMLVWDETMADSVVRYFRAEDRPTLRMAVLAGSGHIADGVGIPDHVRKNLRVRALSVIPFEVTAGERPAWGEVLKAPPGDYLWITRPTPERKPKEKPAPATPSKKPARPERGRDGR